MNIVCLILGHKPVAGRENWKGKHGHFRIKYRDVKCGRCLKLIADRVGWVKE